MWSGDPPFVSYAQNWEDVVLWRALKDVESGTYVDVGAADPVLDSVTKAFYDRGWSGVNVEPVAEFHAALESARPRDVNVRAGAASSAGQLTLHRFEGTGLSTFVSEVADGARASRAGDETVVEVRRLDEILSSSLDPTSAIHFLKIDVEGFEHDVLVGVDFSVWRPWIIVVEATEPSSRTRTHHRWEHLLVGADYQFALFDGLNRFYVAAEHEQVFSALSYPVCVFDAPYLSAAHARDIEVLDEANRHWMEAAGELQAKQQMLDAAVIELQAKQQMLDAVVIELQAKQQMLDELMAARIADQHVLAARAEELETTQVMLEHLVEALDIERSELARVRASRSWKVTRPLRVVSTRLPGSRR